MSPLRLLRANRLKKNFLCECEKNRQRASSRRKWGRFYDIEFFQNVAPALPPHTSDSNPSKRDSEIRKIAPNTRNQPTNSLTKTLRIS